MSVLIKFVDGEELIIEDANSYTTSHESNQWKVVKGENYLFLNKKQVKYIGDLAVLRPGK